MAVALSQDKAAREQADRLEVVEGLRNTEERYRLLVQSTNDAIWNSIPRNQTHRACLSVSSRESARSNVWDYGYTNAEGDRHECPRA